MNLRVSSILVMAAALWLPAMNAWAQIQPAPAPTLKNTSPPWVGFLVMAVLTGFVLAVSLMPSKRSHQD